MAQTKCSSVIRQYGFAYLVAILCCFSPRDGIVEEQPPFVTGSVEFDVRVWIPALRTITTERRGPFLKTNKPSSQKANPKVLPFSVAEKKFKLRKGWDRSTAALSTRGILDNYERSFPHGTRCVGAAMRIIARESSFDHTEGMKKGDSNKTHQGLVQQWIKHGKVAKTKEGQLKWAVAYWKRRYNCPCYALDHLVRFNWQ